VRNHGRPSGRSSGIQAVQRATTVPQAQLARTPSQPMCAHVPRVEPLAGTHRAPPHGRGGLAWPRHGGGPTLTASQNLTTRAVRDKLKVETTGDGCDAGSSHSVGVEHTCGEDE
jgi:hypothetical protein